MQDPHEHTIDPKEYLASDELPGAEHEHHVHVTPVGTMVWVFVILLVLTALTVWSSNLHGFQFGNTYIGIGATAHVVIAMTIAVVKALLVAAYFMHLLYDKKVNSIVVVSTVFALSLFLGLTLMDMDTRDVVSKDEVGEIYPGGNVSLYKRQVGNAAAAGFQGNIVTAAQEAGIAAQGHGEEADAPAADDDAGPGDDADGGGDAAINGDGGEDPDAH